MMTPSRFAAVALLIAGLAGPARAQNQSLQIEMGEMAKEVADILKSMVQPVESVHIAAFTGPAAKATSGGAVVQQCLAEALPKHGIRVAAAAGVGIQGGYEDVKDPGGLLAVQISATVVDKSGKKLFECTKRGAYGDALVSSVMGVSAKLPVTASAKERGEIIERAIDQPGCHVSGASVSCDAQAKYAIELLVAAKPGGPFAARRAKVVDGLAFAPLRRGEVFAVRLINNSDYDAAAALTLDGLNVYAFSDVKDAKGRPKYSQVILDKGKSALIKGWHRTNDYSDEFTIAEYSKSAAFELRSGAKTGTIQVSFAAAWPKGGPKPPDEPANPNEHSRSAGPDAVGRGAKVYAKFQEVAYDVGVVRESVSVRYDKK